MDTWPSLEQISFIFQNLGSWRGSPKSWATYSRLPGSSVNSELVSWPQRLFHPSSLDNASSGFTFTSWDWTCLDLSVFLNENGKTMHLYVPGKNILSIHKSLSKKSAPFLFVYPINHGGCLFWLRLCHCSLGKKKSLICSYFICPWGKQKHKING